MLKVEVLDKKFEVCDSRASQEYSTRIGDFTGNVALKIRFIHDIFV